MSNQSNTLALLIALGAGALVGLSASTTKPKLPSLGGGGRASLEGAQPLPAVEIALGSTLVEAGGGVRESVTQVPQAIRNTLGFGPAQLAFKEDVDLPYEGYAVRLRGLTVASGRIQPSRLLALRTAASHDQLAGEEIDAPGLGRGVWIDEADAGQARLLGYDVLEPGFVLALHVDTVLRRHLFELLTREETYRLLERTRQTEPKTVEELCNRLEVGVIQKVLRELLREQVALRDLPLVLELLTDAAARGNDPAQLTEEVRQGLSRQLCAALADDDGVLHVLPLGQRWEQLRGANPGDGAVHELAGQLRKQVDVAREHNLRAVLVAPKELRAHARRLLERELPDLPVLSEAEVVPGTTLTPINPSLVSA